MVALFTWIRSLFVVNFVTLILPLQWRYSECHGVSNHQLIHCLLNRLLRPTWKNTSNLRVIGFCEGNPPVTGEFPLQSSSNAGNISICRRHHAQCWFTGTLVTVRLPRCQWSGLMRWELLKCATKKFIHLLFIQHRISWRPRNYCKHWFSKCGVQNISGKGQTWWLQLQHSALDYGYDLVAIVMVAYIRVVSHYICQIWPLSKSRFKMRKKHDLPPVQLVLIRRKSAFIQSPGLTTTKKSYLRNTRPGDR